MSRVTVTLKALATWVVALSVRTVPWLWPESARARLLASRAAVARRCVSHLPALRSLLLHDAGVRLTA